MLPIRKEIPPQAGSYSEVESPTLVTTSKSVSEASARDWPSRKVDLCIFYTPCLSAKIYLELVLFLVLQSGHRLGVSLRKECKQLSDGQSLSKMKTLLAKNR